MAAVAAAQAQEAVRQDAALEECIGEFAALARRLGVKLVTMDRKLLKAFAPQAVALTAV